jgi:broad specificity phosphatase PhoE
MLSPVLLKVIICSDLKCTMKTAEAIQDAQAEPKPLKITSTLFREQNYGSGEGKKWDTVRIPGLTLEEHYERGLYPVDWKDSPEEKALTI